jgi:hypothetical protein
MITMMVLMMGFMFVFAIAGAVLLLKFIQDIVGSMDGKAKRTELEKPKRHRLALSDDGELVDINDEDETSLLYEGEERR